MNISREWKKIDCPKNLENCNLLGGKNTKCRSKTTWVAEFREIMVEMGFAEEDWRDRENWPKKITGQIQMGTGRCETLYNWDFRLVKES